MSEIKKGMLLQIEPLPVFDADESGLMVLKALLLSSVEHLQLVGYVCINILHPAPHTEFRESRLHGA